MWNPLCVIGGAKYGVFYTKRYGSGCGLNSTGLDFLPVYNMEDGDLDLVAGSVPLGKHYIFVVVHGACVASSHVCGDIRFYRRPEQ